MKSLFGRERSGKNIDSTIEIISMDLSCSEDFSSIFSVCSACRQVIEIKQYDAEVNGCELTVFKNCPHCGVKLEKHIINE